MGRSKQASTGLKVWEHPKKSGIKVRQRRNPSGIIGYRVTVPTKLTGKTGLLVKQFKAKEEACTWAETEAIKYLNQGRHAQDLTMRERLQAHEAISLLKEFAIPLDEGARMLSDLLRRVRGVDLSLAEAVDFAVGRLRPVGGVKAFSDVVDELTAIKASADLRERSLKDFKDRSHRMKLEFAATPIPEITGEAVKIWLLSLNLSPRSRKNYLAVAGEIFRFAIQKRYLVDNPLSEMTTMERKSIAGSGNGEAEPSILTVAEALRLLETARRNPELDLLGAVALALFCGIRTEELKRMDWSEVRLSDEEPFVVIPKGKAKKRRIRHVPIPANAVKWLLLCPRRSGLMVRNDYVSDHQKRFRRLQQLAGFGRMEEKNGRRAWRSTWRTNCMRHSFGTYDFALHGDSMRTSRLLGHKATDDVLFDHYRALATKENATAYFAITPAEGSAQLGET